MSSETKIVNSIEIVDDPITYKRSYRFTGEITSELVQDIVTGVYGYSFEQFGKDIITDLTMLRKAQKT